MSMVIVGEIVIGIFVLAAVTRFAVRETRQRRSESLQPQSEPQHTPEVREQGGEGEAEQHPSEVVDRA